MMHPYQLHSLGKLYHEEALKEARVRHLEHRVRAPQTALGEAGALVPARQADHRRCQALVREQSAKSLKRERGGL
jgi:N-methylhydantoinase B/oxoprolinase/acetone carboxylase alpha subunit